MFLTMMISFFERMKIVAVVVPTKNLFPEKLIAKSRFSICLLAEKVDYDDEMMIRFDVHSFV